MANHVASGCTCKKKHFMQFFLQCPNSFNRPLKKRPEMNFFGTPQTKTSYIIQWGQKKKNFRTEVVDLNVQFQLNNNNVHTQLELGLLPRVACPKFGHLTQTLEIYLSICILAFCYFYLSNNYLKQRFLENVSQILLD